MRGGPFDLSLEFGYSIPSGKGEVADQTTWLVRVAMSWEHAVALHKFLGHHIQEYETQVGPLPNIEKLRVKVEES